MKRFHVHLVVPELDESVRFYSSMFGAEPTVPTADLRETVAVGY